MKLLSFARCLENCKGEPTKKRMVELANITMGVRLLYPVALHTGCCDPAPLKDAWRFNYMLKDGSKSGHFYVGECCGMQFADRLHINPPPRLNPYRLTHGSESIRDEDTGERRRRPLSQEESSHDRISYDPMSLELFVIATFIESRGRRRTSGLLRDIIDNFEKNPSTRLKPWYAKGVNTALSRYEKPLHIMFAEGAKKNPDLKHIDTTFPHCAKWIDENPSVTKGQSGATVNQFRR